MLITGGFGGIGKEITRAFLKNGFHVIVFAQSGTTFEKAQRELHKEGEIKVFSVDVSDYTQVKKAITAVIRQCKRIDCLVNAAGIHGVIGFFPETVARKWHEAVRVNLLGTFNMIHAVLPHMLKRGRGKIINFSGGGAASPRPFFSAYAASKAGIVNLTENLAAELREKKAHIDVNVIAPGAINTRLLDEMLAAGPQKVGVKEYKNLLAQKKNGGASAEDVAELCVFLASEETDGVTGKFISAVHDRWRDFPKHKKALMETDIYTLRRIKPKDRGYDW
ncbi:MAG: SDR family oxidoreductase [Parcubacteria group bacterium]|nr:SDR family oxidoreductase [Parcubacteria group bacterium]